jgi:hypothetical protein
MFSCDEKMKPAQCALCTDLKISALREQLSKFLVGAVMS